jgi:hypothetical protein
MVVLLHQYPWMSISITAPLYRKDGLSEGGCDETLSENGFFFSFLLFYAKKMKNILLFRAELQRIQVQNPIQTLKF